MTQISRRALFAAAAVAPLAAGAAAPVKVSSKLDTEAGLLGTIILQLLKSGGVPVENRLRLGSTKILRTAILAGEVDITPNTPATARSSSTRRPTRSGRARSRAMNG